MEFILVMFYKTLKKMYILLLCGMFFNRPVVFHHIVICVISDIVFHDGAESIFLLIFCLLLPVTKRDTEMLRYNYEFVSFKSISFFFSYLMLCCLVHTNLRLLPCLLCKLIFLSPYSIPSLTLVILLWSLSNGSRFFLVNVWGYTFLHCFASQATSTITVSCRRQIFELSIFFFLRGGPERASCSQDGLEFAK